ncbi:MAG: archaeosortase/exosortase family protein [Candidatus Aenigmarchaeota archaeon]|nr:archaeosortase/exosortase family protein [Candidatus Aenigmarchaeota archaeon]
MAGNLQEKENLIQAGLFLLKVNVLLIPFYVISYIKFTVLPLQTGFAALIAFMLKAFNLQVLQADQFLYLGADKYPIDISFDCLGWKSVYSLSVLVIATPGNIKEKLHFLKIWLPVLIAINIFRIISIILLGNALGYQYIEAIHNNIWQIGIIGLVVGVWYLWLKKM